MPTRRCCCTKPGCLICSDDFNRANENPVSGNWTEKSGDWSVSNQTLVAVSDGELLTSCRQDKPWNTTYNYRVVVDLITTATTWGIICKYTSPGNYDWIEFYTSSTDLFPRFWRRTGGADVLIMDITTHPAGTALNSAMPTTVNVEICYTEVGWTVSAGPSTWTTCDCTAPTALPADTTVGFVGFNQGDFDNFEYYYHALSNRLCEICDCYCINPGDETDYKCIPETLTLTLTPVVNHTDCTVTPVTFTITLKQSLPTRPVSPPPTYPPHPEKHLWYSDPVATWEPTYDPIEFWFRLECFGNGLFELIMLEYGPDDTVPFETGKMQFAVLDGPNGGTINTSIECTPIIITFPNLVKNQLQLGSGGPFLCDPFDAKEYSTVITE